jgi:hypothetical protein
MDDAAFLHQTHGSYLSDMQQQQLQHSPSKQAWPNLSSPKGQSPASSPWSKLPAVATASSPDPDSRNQVWLHAQHSAVTPVHNDICCLHTCLPAFDCCLQVQLVIIQTISAAVAASFDTMYCYSHTCLPHCLRRTQSYSRRWQQQDGPGQALVPKTPQHTAVTVQAAPGHLL